MKKYLLIIVLLAAILILSQIYPLIPIFIDDPQLFWGLLEGIFVTGGVGIYIE